METLLYLLILAADIWAIYNIVKSSAEMPMKIVWCLVVLILPVIGLIIWYFAGPKEG
jgi:hypothetical protein